MRIRGLIVEDDRDMIPTLQDTLTLYFESVGLEVVWTVCLDAITGRMTVRTSQPFDFAIVDFGLGQERENGIAVVEEIRRREGDQAFVVVVTSQSREYPGFAAQASRAKADGAIIRGQLNDRFDEDWSFAGLATQVWRHLVSVGRPAGGRIIIDEADIGLLSIIESLGGEPPVGKFDRGRRILLGLAMGCLGPQYSGESTVTLSYLAPGRSGAHVCRIDLDRRGEPTESFVLKVGLDRAALEHERRKSSEAVKVLGEQALVMIRDQVQRDSSGYHAIVARLADRAIPLGAWLTGCAHPDSARELANVLFREHLARLVDRGLGNEVAATEWARSLPLLKLRSAAAVDMYEPILKRLGADRLGNDGRQSGGHSVAEVLRRFASDGELPARRGFRRLAGKVLYVKGFGDLHSGNVLVQTGVQTRPVLVDASRYGPQHWAGDAARLLVDLLLRTYRSGPESMLWEDFASAAGTFGDVCRLCPNASRANDGSAVAEFVDEVVTKLDDFLRVSVLDISTSEWHWQWHLALAKEFLRQASQAGLKPPRAAAGLVAAAHHLYVTAQQLDYIDQELAAS